MTIGTRLRAIVSAYDAAFGRGAAWNDLQAGLALGVLLLWALTFVGALAIVGGGHAG